VPSPVALAMLAGLLGAVQPRVNTELGTRIGNDLVAATINFLVALVVISIVVALRPGTRRRLARLRDWEVPWWTWAGGLGGALVVLAGVVTVDTIGVATFSLAFFAGQVASGLAVDAFGLAPGGRRPATAARFVASALALAAVAISQLGRSGGEVEPALVAFVVVTGVAVSLQSAGNARMASVTGDAIAATAVNVVVGTVALCTIVAVGAIGGADRSLAWPGEPWLYLGGILGVGIVLSLAMSTAALGVLRATLAVVAAQLVAAFVVDAVVDGTSPRAGAIAGALVLVGAVALLQPQVKASTIGR
jgi:transporter family-2 protein